MAQNKLNISMFIKGINSLFQLQHKGKVEERRERRIKFAAVRN